jgi:hypothetical protein
VGLPLDIDYVGVAVPQHPHDVASVPAADGEEEQREREHRGEGNDPDGSAHHTLERT